MPNYFTSAIRQLNLIKIYILLLLYLSRYNVVTLYLIFTYSIIVLYYYVTVLRIRMVYACADQNIVAMKHYWNDLYYLFI